MEMEATVGCSTCLIQKIIFGTDFSPASRLAASYARAVAKHLGAEVEIVHVFDEEEYISPEDRDLPSTGERCAMRYKRLDLRSKSFSRAGVKTSSAMPTDLPIWQALLREADKFHADLFVVGTQSKGEVGRLLLGSTTEQLIRHSTLPVMTVGPYARLIEPEDYAFKRIIFATDFSDEALLDFSFARSLSEQSRTQLYLVHVIDPLTEPSEESAVVEEKARKAMNALIPEDLKVWCSSEIVIEYGDGPHRICALASKVDADLIVLGASRPSFWLTYLRQGVSQRVIAQAICPVLTMSALREQTSQ